MNFFEMLFRVDNGSKHYTKYAYAFAESLDEAVKQAKELIVKQGGYETVAELIVSNPHDINTPYTWVVPVEI